MTDVLTLDGVSAGYGPFHALFDVSLAVAPGEAVALLGANGVGKTTVARVASGLVAPERGQGSGRPPVAGPQLEHAAAGGQLAAPRVQAGRNRAMGLGDASPGKRAALLRVVVEGPVHGPSVVAAGGAANRAPSRRTLARTFAQHPG